MSSNDPTLPPSADEAGLLQPYIDGELSGEEAERVARLLEERPQWRTAVQEQAFVRTALRGLERERAPQALRARIQLALDEEDRTRARELPLARRPWRERLGAMMRGAMVAVPAMALSLAFFVLGRGSVPSDEASDGSLAAALGQTLWAPASGSGRASLPRRDIQLVGARLARAEAPRPTDRLGAELDYDVDHGSGRIRVVDLQMALRHEPPKGQQHHHLGGTYYLDRDDSGRPTVRFEAGGVAHVLTYRGAGPTPTPAGEAEGAIGPDFSLLLHVAHELRTAATAR